MEYKMDRLSEDYFFTGMSVQWRVRSGQSGRGAGGHDQALPVARPTTEF